MRSTALSILGVLAVTLLSAVAATQAAVPRLPTVGRRAIMTHLAG